MNRRLRVVAHLHAYPPRHNAGAEWMAHAILKHLHQVHDVEAHVLVSRPPSRRDTFEGIGVEHNRDPRRSGDFYRWADVVITHLDVTRQAMRLARQYRKPLVHLVHNDRQLGFHKVDAAGCQLAVYNSQWIAAAHAEHPSPGMVLYPPVWCADYTLGPPTPPGAKCVALLNTTPAKGSDLFWELARRLPDVLFLAVRGSYGEQAQPPTELRNVLTMRNQPDVRKVYRKATVVVMPSHYESWGRVAVEAAAAGRPSIATPTPGLSETGVPWRLVELADVDGWVDSLRTLLDHPGIWHDAVENAQLRARQLEVVSTVQLAELYDRLCTLAGGWQPPDGQQLDALPPRQRSVRQGG